MDFESKLEELAIRLFEIDAVKFGEFTTKSGIQTPIYFDLRVIVSYPDVMKFIANLIQEFAFKEVNCNHLCGVPYTALPIATLLSVQAQMPMLMRRKEAKAYGTKKMIEGHYKPGEKCLIIEDVVTSGMSVLETVKDLRQIGLIAEEAIIILDREQGGSQNLSNNGVQMKSLFTMTKLVQILVKNEKISNGMALKVKAYLNETPSPKTNNVADRTQLTYEERSEHATNPIAKRLFQIIATKKTNLCLSADLTVANNILKLVERVGEHVCMVKTHVDIIEDFNEEFTLKLKLLSNKFNFLILEDRKYADIGNTVSLQYSKGLYKVAEWADCVTVHSLPGEGVLKAINTVSNGIRNGVFLLAEMSSEGNLISSDYKEETVKMAAKYSNLITGYVCQNKDTFKEPGLIQLTPGVQLEKSRDDLGQVYNTPEKVILEKGADVVVVGRGITATVDPESQASLYRSALWTNYLKRVSGKLD